MLVILPEFDIDSGFTQYWAVFTRKTKVVFVFLRVWGVIFHSIIVFILRDL